MASNGLGQLHDLPINFRNGSISHGRARHGSIGRDPSIDMSTQVRGDALSSQRKPTPFVAEMAEFAPELLKSVDNYTSEAMIHIPGEIRKKRPSNRGAKSPSALS